MTDKELKELVKKRIIAELDDLDLQDWLLDRIMPDIADELQDDHYEDVSDLINDICSDLSKKVK